MTGTHGKITPQCQPWSADDLIARLQTFGAWKWFAKPKGTGPMACARRGWISKEMDVIACEVSHLPFPTILDVYVCLGKKCLTL
jgi:C3HC zinc finger-like